MDRLPPLRLLTTFEEVARLGSMQAAAARLNVTRPAVTQAIRQLEDHIGAPLLDRTHRPARLTAAGEQLAQSTRDGFGQIIGTVEGIRAAAAHAPQVVTVACTPGMATYWLMPRLADFYAADTGITLNVQAPHSDLPMLAPGVDLALRYCAEASTARSTHLFDEEMCPVGSPALIAQLQQARISLADAPLIHVRSDTNAHWLGWPDYLCRRGLRPGAQPGQIYDNYVQATQAALGGLGVMLGWRSITAALVADGALAPWPEGGISAGAAYRIIEPASLSPAARTVRDWLAAQGGTARPAPCQRGPTSSASAPVAISQSSSSDVVFGTAPPEGGSTA